MITTAAHNPLSIVVIHRVGWKLVLQLPHITMLTILLKHSWIWTRIRSAPKSNV